MAAKADVPAAVETDIVVMGATEPAGAILAKIEEPGATLKMEGYMTD